MSVLRRHLLGAAFTGMLAGCGDGTSPDPGPPVGFIAVYPDHPFGAPIVVAGTMLQLRVSVSDSAGNPILNPTVAWSSADPGKATVSATGLVTGIVPSPSTVTIRARVGGEEGTLEVLVVEPAQSLAPMPTSIGIVPGGQTDVITGFRNAAGDPLDPFGRTVAWASSNPAVAPFTYGDLIPGAPRGTVIGEAPGSTTITVNAPNAFASIAVDVSVVTFTSVATAFRTTCGVTTSGAAYCWGVNIANLLANPLVSGSATPLRVEGAGSFSAISPGASETCGIGLDGAAYCWGNNSFGQLGNGTSDPSANGVSTPTAVAGGLHFSALSSGEGSVCALTTAGQPYCWGYGGDGQLGNGGTASSSMPVAVSGSPSLSRISLFSRHACGVASDGNAYCWGNNIDGQLGDSSTTNRTSAVSVAGGHSFSFISAGIRHTCGIVGTQAYCWGDNSFGQLGRSSPSELTPAPVGGGLQFSSVSAGYTHSCGLTPAGAAYCWGTNDVGQLGDGSNTDSATPVPVSGGHTFSSLNAGNLYTCGLTVEQVAYCWGASELDGATGTGVNGSTVPRRVIGQL
jgi:alpha-tubulin suppressor-like RCC1 family protein